MWYSVRRAGIDAELFRHAHLFVGDVLEIGSGRQRRGRFVEPQTASWTRCDIETDRRPDVVGDIQRLPYARRCFDVVVCLEVLEYVDRPQTALEEIREVLKPDGLLLLSVPFMHRMDSEHDFWRFTRKGLVRILQDSGFDVAECNQQGNALSVVANLIKQCLCAIDNSVIRRGLSLAFVPVVWGLCRLDGGFGSAHERLLGSTTGYLTLSRRRATVHDDGKTPCSRSGRGEWANDTTVRSKHPVEAGGRLAPRQ